MVLQLKTNYIHAVEGPSCWMRVELLDREASCYSRPAFVAVVKRKQTVIENSGPVGVY
jgi:hypothetical protein